MRNKLTDNLGTISKIIQTYLLGKAYPLSVTFLVTYRCNFSCHYCDIWKHSGPEMTTTQIISMIDEFTKMGLRRFSFNGGEPLLRPDIEELISYCRQKKLFTTIFTNGWLVEEKINILKKLDTLIISFDGPQDVHDFQRNKPGSYARVIDAIKKARQNNILTLTNTVITKNNVKHLDFILDRAKELGFFIIFQPVLKYSHSVDKYEINKLDFDKTIYQDAIRLLIKRKKEGANIIHSLNYLKYVLEPDWNTNKRKCWAGKLYCAVKPNGEVAPCYPVFNEKRWPNGLELGFYQAFKQSQINTCAGCYCIIVESDFFYSLYPEVIFNILKKLPLH